MDIVRVYGDIAPYEWGGDGAISRLMGWQRDNDVEAEWWLGTHPLRPSRVESGELLTQWLSQQQGEGELPFLFKVLAPQKPLSLQVHPSPDQAAEGFAREQAAGVALDAPTRIFKDPFAKPELVVALQGTFHALAGLRPAPDTANALRALAGDALTPGIGAWLEMLETKPTAEVVAWLLRGEGLASGIPAELGEFASHDDTLSRLHQHYPGDPGIAVGFMMNRLTLLPGEAAFIDAGQLHAYLEGYAIELMAPSDNVLRGGLTPKHVDVDALLSIARLEPAPPPILEPVRVYGGGVRYQPTGVSFGVGLLEGSDVEATPEVSGPALVVCTDGEWLVQAGSDQQSLIRGDAVVVAAGGDTVRFSGSGQLWWASAE